MACMNDRRKAAIEYAAQFRFYGADLLTYGREEPLRNSILAVLKQDYPNFEFPFQGCTTKILRSLK